MSTEKRVQISIRSLTLKVNFMLKKKKAHYLLGSLMQLSIVPDLEPCAKQTSGNVCEEVSTLSYPKCKDPP